MLINMATMEHALYERDLSRTHATENIYPKDFIYIRCNLILGGLLTFESDWSPPLGKPLVTSLGAGQTDTRLDLGCVAAHGVFSCDAAGSYTITPQDKSVTAFLLR